MHDKVGKTGKGETEKEGSVHTLRKRVVKVRVKGQVATRPRG